MKHNCGGGAALFVSLEEMPVDTNFLSGSLSVTNCPQNNDHLARTPC